MMMMMIMIMMIMIMIMMIMIMMMIIIIITIIDIRKKIIYINNILYQLEIQVAKTIKYEVNDSFEQYTQTMQLRFNLVGKQYL